MEASSNQQQKEKEPRVHRPYAFDKMEGLVREMQDPQNGVPVRSQKQFLTSIPSAFMGYDLVEWLMDRLSIEESGTNISGPFASLDVCADCPGILERI
ncbi:hypothetical protein KPH14_004078 [Odynerus spinipes]|uniref:DEP domain-containing protein n=1 Tax=Odynerus spinipes TaxID=1348599 RepID=A0AAD9VV11_9HYME|nr:hypothetical protein KPH14_004078 [Odynerus spinipes]